MSSGNSSANVNILLLENIHPAARQRLESFAYNVREVPKSLSVQELIVELSGINVLGIRSKTKLPAEVFENAPHLSVVGCFGVGTNQVALDAAAGAGVPVFNAPYSSTRSVAELALGSIIMLARKLGDGNNNLHRGQWVKSAKGCFEIRNKVLGIVGYGHIGQQVGLLAESVGMKILFFDKTKRLALGNAEPTGSMEELLFEADFVSLHLPALSSKKPLIGPKEFSQFKSGSYLINGSRGSLVDIEALKSAVQSGQLAGAALDVYPQEPKTNQEDFETCLKGVENIVLTPHIGGSTEEAQEKIALEVAESFVSFVERGTTEGAVNFPQINLSASVDSHRILNVHKNVPGAVTDINKEVSDLGVNINSQFLATNDTVGYIIMDVDKGISADLTHKLSALSASIKTRIL